MKKTGRTAIACVANYESSTGYAWRMIEEIYLAIAEANPDRDVFVLYPTVDTLNPAIEKSRLLVQEFRVDLKNPERFAQWCARNHIHTVYFTDRPYYSRAYPMLRRSGVRKILMHDHMPGERSRARGLMRLAKSLLARSKYAADYCIACSRPVLERFKETVCLPRHRRWLAENGIDLARFKAPGDIRERLGISETAPVVVSCSRASKYKGVHRIVEAAKEIPRAHFIHIGDGPELANLEALARKLGIEDRFHFLGAVPAEEVPGILMACNIAAHASDGEGLCLAILEFMAAGLPVVAPDLRTIRQSVFSGDTGLLYTPGSAKSLQYALQFIVDEPELCKAYGARARIEVRNRYLLEYTLKDVVGIVRMALEEKDAAKMVEGALAIREQPC